jgi:hypothetical protein
MISRLWACLLYLMIVSESGSNLANNKSSRVKLVESSRKIIYDDDDDQRTCVRVVVQ